MSAHITLHERLETVEQQAASMVDYLRAFMDGTISDGERREAEELCDEYEQDRADYSKQS